MTAAEKEMTYCPSNGTGRSDRQIDKQIGAGYLSIYLSVYLSISIHIYLYLSKTGYLSINPEDPLTFYSTFLLPLHSPSIYLYLPPAAPYRFRKFQFILGLEEKLEFTSIYSIALVVLLVLLIILLFFEWRFIDRN